MLSCNLKKIALSVAAACAFGFTCGSVTAASPLDVLQSKISAQAAKAGVPAPNVREEITGQGNAEVRGNKDKELNGLAKIEKLVTMDANKIRVVKATDGTIMYLIDNGRFAISGTMYDLWNRKQLTTIEDVQDAVSHINLKRLGFQLSKTNHVTVGEGKERVTLFVDPRCPWCHKLLKIIEKDKSILKDYTFDVVVLAILGDESRNVAERFACAKGTPMEKFSALTQGPSAIRKLERDSSCEPREILKSTDLQMRALDMTSVPFLISADNRFVRGMPENLREFLDEAKAKEKERRAEENQQRALRYVEENGPFADLPGGKKERERVRLNKQRPAQAPEQGEARAPEQVKAPAAAPAPAPEAKPAPKGGEVVEILDLVGEKNFHVERSNHVTIGTGPKEITIFVDPRCSWCHRLIDEVADDADLLRAYTLHFVVVAVLGDESTALAEKIGCADADNMTRFKALREGADAINALPQKEACEKRPVRYNRRAVNKGWITSVPLVVGPDMRVNRGKPQSFRAWVGMPKAVPPGPKVKGPSDQETEYDLSAKGFNLADTNHISIGKGAKHVTIFVDPQCGWCHRLMEDLQDEIEDGLLDEFTLDIVILGILGDRSQELARTLACAKADPMTKFNALVDGGSAIDKLEKKENCSRSIVRKTSRMQEKLEINSVPFIVTHDKRIARGKPADIGWYLRAQFDENGKVK